MTPATLPSKLYRPLAEVKSFVEKMPDGVTLTKLAIRSGLSDRSANAKRIR
jgi:hypothetical protein